jgi:hypothetical protein
MSYDSLLAMRILDVLSTEEEPPVGLVLGVHMLVELGLNHLVEEATAAAP